MAAKKKPAKRRTVRKKNGQFTKGNPGRPKGTPNKTPTQLVSKILEIDGQLSLEGKGLLDCAKQDPKWFYEKILAKVLPKNIDFSMGDEKISEIKVKWAK